MVRTLATVHIIIPTYVHTELEPWLWTIEKVLTTILSLSLSSYYSHIEEDSGSVFGIVTSERTYHLTADDGNDKREWCELIRRVKGMPEAKVQSILAQEVDSRKALMSIDVELIDSVSAIQDDKK